MSFWSFLVFLFNLFIEAKSRHCRPYFTVALGFIGVGTSRPQGERSVCSGNVRRLPTKSGNLPNALRRLSRSLQDVSDMSNMIYNLYTSERIHSPLLRTLTIPCTDTMVNITDAISGQCLTNLGNHFGQMINISSVLSSIVDEENELNFKNLLGDLHNLVYDVICSMFHLGMASGISLPVSFTAPEIENECVNVNSILLRWKLIKNIELVAFILREKYAEW